MTSLLEKVISVIAPHKCINCSKSYNILCDPCSFDAFGQLPSTCFRCGQPTADFAVCASCRFKTPLSYVWTAANYDGVAEALIKLFKFERVQAAARPLGKALAGVVPYFPEEVIIVPIPTTNGRARQRGYDQSVLLAKELSHIISRAAQNPLVRVGGFRQLGATRQQRFRQAKSSLQLKDGKRYRGKHIVLVDDVLTTGATIQAAAELFNSAGANTIEAVVAARQPLSGNKTQ